jgi:hypothetical protein
MTILPYILRKFPTLGKISGVLFVGHLFLNWLVSRVIDRPHQPTGSFCMSETVGVWFGWLAGWLPGWLAGWMDG